MSGNGRFLATIVQKLAGDASLYWVAGMSKGDCNDLGW